MTRLILVLGDQLSDTLSALKEADKSSDVVVMAEVRDEASYVPHHPKKIAFLFAAMRKFASRLREDGWDVRYTTLDDDENSHSIVGELLRYAEATGAEEVIATEPGEWRLIEALEDAPLKVRQLPDDRFLCSRADFEDWAKGRDTLRMEYFYREMRRKTGLLMDGDNPEGGAWNYDGENRKPPPAEADPPAPMQFTPDDEVEAVLDLVEREFGDNFGKVRPFWLATDQTQARRALSKFIREALPKFGDYQDAMMTDQRFLWHGVLSPYLNAGLLTPLEICEAAAEAYRAGDVPLNCAEGFIRQIIGWREYIRGIYFLKGPDYPHQNKLMHQRGLPDLFWGGETRMHCLSQTIRQVEEEAYAHHIQRLMVLGNFALLTGLNPGAVHDWFMASFIDAYEWVMAANVIGMSQFADGGVVASKPYVSSANYIKKMSDYCGDCHYSATKKTGDGACPFNLLYWQFLDRHRERFEGNHRMGQMYATWDRMDDAKKQTIRDEAEDFLDRMSKGEVV